VILPIPDNLAPEVMVLRPHSVQTQVAPDFWHFPLRSFKELSPVLPDVEVLCFPVGQTNHLGRTDYGTGPVDKTIVPL
jgi:hypothetical protein